MGPIGCPETSVWNHHCRLHKIPEQQISHLHRGGYLKSRMIQKHKAFSYILDDFPEVDLVESETCWK